MFFYYCGIDPGQKGAIALLHKQHVVLFDMPLLPNNEIDARGFSRLFETHTGAFCVLEQAQVMPKQGAVSGFNYGVGYGTIKAALRLLLIPFEEVRPAKWKKAFSLGHDKTESVTKVLELMPGLVDKTEFYTPRGRLLDGRAEALLLAIYAQRMYEKI